MKRAGGLNLKILLCTIVILSIIFETFQRLYYSRRFNLRDDITFFDVLKSQIFRWSIWVVLAFLLALYVRESIKKDKLKLENYFKYFLIIIILMIVGIAIIAFFNCLAIEDKCTCGVFFSDYFVFFVYQRVPIYTLNFTAVAIISYQYFINEQLVFEVQKLIELKKDNKVLHDMLKMKMDDRTNVLSIKVGNTRKVIAIHNITWIQSDDYCARIFTHNNRSYSMRTSLKALENHLGNDFIRVHRNAIVNVSYVDELKLSPSPQIVLKGNIRVPVSQRNLKMVKMYLSA